MLIKKSDDVRSSEITPEREYLNRREFLAAAGITAAGMLASGAVARAFAHSAMRQEDKPNTWEEITGYNNYYEFGTDKEDPAANAGKFRTRPWTVKVDGLVKKPGDYP